MYFVLSKTVGKLLLLPDFFFSIGILGLALLFTPYSRFGNRLVLGAFGALVICGMLPIGAAMLMPLENRFPVWIPTQEAPTGIVVLGGGIDEYLSEERGETTPDRGFTRIIAAAKLARRYPNARIIYTGGSSNLTGKDIREADYAAQAFEDLGISKSRIEIERDARNTAENAVRAKAIASPKQRERWLLVTSAYHMPRSVELFRKTAFVVEPVPTDWQTGPTTFWRLDPLRRLGQLKTASREWIGLAVLWVTGNAI
ncbi:YdcF family protein [Bradyrhizobium ottawaense]|uniref:YdcF family protein n=1 Tax=Bradyrhizobium ottawaense TaxID=931866 RepID=UPI001BAB3E4E|nr:YdcF family protein [Bradyrhizobium ottawaense]MBR1363442.1 YdcF family protein [Bradyrhizobium ottawaense]